MLPIQVSGATANVSLGGQEFTIVALSDKDFDEITLWHQGRIIRMARAAFDETMTEADRQEILKAAVAQAKDVDFLTELYAPGGLLNKMDWSIQLWYRLLRKRNPKIGPKEVKEMMQKHMDDFANAMDVWKLMQFGGIPETEAEDPKKNADTSPAA